MARRPLTEYAAKRLILGDAYAGMSVTPHTRDLCLARLSPDTAYAVKIDVGRKKRGAHGLVKTNVAAPDVAHVLEAFFRDGFSRCLVEPYLAHEKHAEKYLSIELMREGCVVRHSDVGGIDVEQQPHEMRETIIPLPACLCVESYAYDVPGVALSSLLTKMHACNLSFLETNPYVLDSDAPHMLDLAVEVDTAKALSLPDWTHEHILTQAATPEERAIAALDASSQASFALRVLHPDGAVLTLLSGGGASLVVMDALAEAGLAKRIINYSEYSGAPTRDEMCRYTNALLALLFASSAQKKVILIAGGVANFTDVRTTLQGVLDALAEHKPALHNESVALYVRRGGVHQEQGLALIRDFLHENSIPGLVFGPEHSLADVGNDVKQLL